VLGGLEGIKYRSASIILNEGDRLFIYTDGVTEAHNEENKLYGEERLKEFLNSYKDVSIKELVDILKDDIHLFAGNTPQSDDITILTLEYLKQKESIGVTKVFDADRDELYNCMHFINDELDKFGSSKRSKSQIDLVVEEIFVNIALHGYQSVQGDVEITVNVIDDMATIIFKDRGVPFNPLLRKDPDLTASVEEREIGGLGIWLSKEMMDSIDYEFKNGQNILTIKKKIKE
jgi:sigma-B regulation protein RsbU (phosphoserine phosphatase)